MALARQTHFTQGEINQLREEFQRLPGAGAGKVDLPTFKNVVSRAVPEFPSDLCSRLFDKLDAFRVGRLTFVEIVCGMSALSLGTMDEKLQMCFDLFDSAGRRALTLTDLGDLCTVLFRVALAQGFDSAKKASTFEDAPGFGTGPGGTLRQSLKSRRSTPWGRLQSGEKRVMSYPAGDLVPPKSPQSAGLYDSQIERAPWRSMLLRLLAAAQATTPGGPLLVTFEDFRSAAHMEPALLCLFAWCLPRPPAMNTDHIELYPRSTSTTSSSSRASTMRFSNFSTFDDDLESGPTRLSRFVDV